MQLRQVFETTLIDEDQDLAMGALSLPRGIEASAGSEWSPSTLLNDLGLRIVVEVPKKNLDGALAAVLETNDVTEAAAYLDSPDPSIRAFVPDDLALSNHQGDALVSQARRHERDSESGDRSTRLQPKPERRRKPVSAYELRAFAGGFTSEAVVPFQRSPIDLYPISSILVSDELRTFLVTVRSNPLLLLYTAGGALLLYPVLGVAEGVRSGLSSGLRYRIMKRFGVPEDLIKSEMNGDD